MPQASRLSPYPDRLGDNSALSAIRILRLPQVCERTDLCRSMIYQLEAEQRFPRRIKIGVRAVGWLEEEVQGWLTQRVVESRRTPARST